MSSFKSSHLIHIASKNDDKGENVSAKLLKYRGRSRILERGSDIKCVGFFLFSFFFWGGGVALLILFHVFLYIYIYP